MSEVVVQRRSLWHDGRFRAMWASQAVSQFGDRISELAIPLIAVVVLDASANQVGLLTAAVWLPNFISLVVGSWVDHRTHKRRLMVYADLFRAALLISVPISWAFDALSLALLYGVALFTGAAAVLFNTADSAFFVHLVARDAYMEANSKLSSTRSISFIAGPAFGGGLIQLLTAPIAVIVDAVSFLVSAVLLGRIRIVEKAPDVDHAIALWRRSIHGLRYVVRHPYLRAGLGCATTVNFFTFMTTALLILFASRELGLSAGLIGLAFGIGATGGLLGALIAPRLSRWLGIGPCIALGAVLFPLPIAIVAFAGGPLWLTASLLAGSEFLSSVGVMVFDINLNSLQATVIPDAMRSRVSGAFSTINYGVRPIGAIVGGLVGTAIGIRPTLLVAAVGGALSVLWLVASPIISVRRLEELEDAETFGVLR